MPPPGLAQSEKGRIAAPATILTDSQRLLAAPVEALLLFGKDLGKKSLFPYQSQAIRF
jgi:hypothetical protein